VYICCDYILFLDEAQAVAEYYKMMFVGSRFFKVPDIDRYLLSACYAIICLFVVLLPEWTTVR
jgi:hypothetical protein